VNNNWGETYAKSKRNLISFGTLDAKGYRFSSQGEALKVSKGAIVVLKGQMSRCLYRLVENVQMGGAARGAIASDSSEKGVARRKWLMFASSIEGGRELSQSSQVKPLVLIFIKVEIVGINKHQKKK